MSKIVPCEQRWLSIKADCNLIQISPYLSTIYFAYKTNLIPSYFRKVVPILTSKQKQQELLRYEKCKVPI